jgi:ABC-type arginine/histidine transport system permease subunit
MKGLIIIISVLSAIIVIIFLISLEVDLLNWITEDIGSIARTIIKIVFFIFTFSPFLLVGYVVYVGMYLLLSDILIEFDNFNRLN